MVLLKLCLRVYLGLKETSNGGNRALKNDCFYLMLNCIEEDWISS